jgi:hypothetical protein
MHMASSCNRMYHRNEIEPTNAKQWQYLQATALVALRRLSDRGLVRAFASNVKVEKAAAGGFSHQLSVMDAVTSQNP